MNRIHKTIIHIWISIVALAAFVFSWVLLAHSPKPAPLVQTQSNSSTGSNAAQTTTIDQTGLAPIKSLNDYLNSSASTNQVQSIQPNVNVNTNVARPRLRTRGS